MFIDKLKFPKREDGQGLVEYALILVLVAIVVIAILSQLGPQISAQFARIITVLGGTTETSGAITGASATYSSGGFGGSDKVTITVTVSETTDVTVTASGGFSQTKSCTGSCIFNYTSSPPTTGTATITAAAGGTSTANW